MAVKSIDQIHEVVFGVVENYAKGEDSSGTWQTAQDVGSVASKTLYTVERGSKIFRGIGVCHLAKGLAFLDLFGGLGDLYDGALKVDKARRGVADTSSGAMGAFGLVAGVAGVTAASAWFLTEILESTSKAAVIAAPIATWVGIGGLGISLIPTTVSLISKLQFRAALQGKQNVDDVITFLGDELFLTEKEIGEIIKSFNPTEDKHSVEMTDLTSGLDSKLEEAIKKAEERKLNRLANIIGEDNVKKIAKAAQESVKLKSETLDFWAKVVVPAYGSKVDKSIFIVKGTDVVQKVAFLKSEDEKLAAIEGFFKGILDAGKAQNETAEQSMKRIEENFNLLFNNNSSSTQTILNLFERCKALSDQRSSIQKEILESLNMSIVDDVVTIVTTLLLIGILLAFEFLNPEVGSKLWTGLLVAGIALPVGTLVYNIARGKYGFINTLIQKIKDHMAKKVDEVEMEERPDKANNNPQVPDAGAEAVTT